MAECPSFLRRQSFRKINVKIQGLRELRNPRLWSQQISLPLSLTPLCRNWALLTWWSVRDDRWASQGALSTGIREKGGKPEARTADQMLTHCYSRAPTPGPCHSTAQDGQPLSFLAQARKHFLLGEEERRGHSPWCAPHPLGRLGHSILEAVMVTKSSKLSRMLPCTAVSFSRKASVNTCSWVHTLMKQSSCMAGMAERVQYRETRSCVN